MSALEPETAFPEVGDTATCNCRIIINSIGNAGAGLVGVLKKVLPFSESRLAALLYQAPSELIGGLSREQADELNGILRSTGLDSEVIGKADAFTPGDARYEVALAIKDAKNMTAIAQMIMEVLGVDVAKAREILCSSPAVLIGKVSASTVEALRQRFEPLQVELDASCPDSACYDVFMGDCPRRDRERVNQLIGDLGDVEKPIVENGGDAASQPLLATGLSKAKADKLWDQLCRTSLPVRLVNRDFERFDLRLDHAPADQGMIEFLVSTTGMPEKVAVKVLEKTPIVIHQNIPFSRMTEYLETIVGLGGTASGHLLAFQVFSIIVEKVGDTMKTSRLLQALGGLNEQESLTAMGREPVRAGKMANPQARWLQQELKRAGTESRLVLQ